MEGLAPDLGKIVAPGYFNANPPGQPAFALTSGDSGTAVSIGQSGGLVNVDAAGAIQMTTVSGAIDITANDGSAVQSAVAMDANGNMTIDTFGAAGLLNITSQNDLNLAAVNGDISLFAQGITLGGGNVTIDYAGYINFDPSGVGALSNVQTINGVVYPPPGGGATSITQAGALVACLGNGAVMISSIGAGITADMMNAGTITFDTTGPRALVNLSTINGAAYVPGGVPANLTVSTMTVNGVGNITLDYIPADSVRSTRILFKNVGHENINDGILMIQKAPVLDITGASVDGLSAFAFSTLGSFQPMIASSYYVAGPDNDTVYGAAQLSYTAVTSSMTLQAPNVALALSSITGISSINGEAWVNGGTVPSALTVSSITAADYVSTISISGISSITSASLITVSTTDELHLEGSSITLGANPGPTDIYAYGDIYLPTNGLQVSSIVGISSINGVEYPYPVPSVSTLTDGTASLSIDVSHKFSINNDFLPAADNAPTIGQSGLAFNSVWSYALEGISTVNGADYNNPAFSTLTAATSISTTALNVSSISGVAWPLSVKQGTFYKSAAQNLTSGNTDITFDLSGAWNNTGGYITHTDGSADFTVVQTGLYQLEFNALVLVNNGTWTTTSNKTINIDITRPSIAEQALITSSGLQGLQSYGQCISGTIYLVAGDVINMRLGNTFTGGAPTPPQAQQLQNTFDLNTFFTWRYIS